MTPRTRRRATEGRAGLARVLALPAAAYVLFVALPLGALVARAVRDDAVVDLLDEPFVLDALRLSLLTSTLTLVLAFVLGVPLAYLLARGSFPGRRVVDVLVDLPLVLPPSVAGVALLVAFGRRGVLGPTLERAGLELAFTTAAVVLAQLFVAAPFLVRTAKAGFEAVDPVYEQVSATLGVSPPRTFWRISLRLSRPALLGGAVLCWARALSELGATLIFAGSFQGRTETMPLAIIAAFESSAGLAGAVALSMLLLAVALALLAALRFALREATEARPGA
jgi:molybdate transport system permease protein